MITPIDPLKEAQAIFAQHDAEEYARLEAEEQARHTQELTERKARLQNYIDKARAYNPPTKNFEGSDGQVYKRRANIRMAEWSEYQNCPEYYYDEKTGVEYDKFFVALFLGKVSPDSLELSHEDRILLGQMVVDSMFTDEYFPVKRAVFEDILNPAVSKSNGADDSKNGRNHE